jgi:fluoride exporter
MPWINFIAVGGGAVVGAWARWGFGTLWNPIFPTLPLGTLAANLTGGFLMGVVIALADPLNFSMTTRLLLTTGFLGGFTTFSAFSAEAATLLLRAQYGWVLAIIMAHVCGSLLMTLAGVVLVRTIVSK